ncbi:MAG: porin PorA family protein [Candidatus Nanopelagicales bacterium]
MSTRAVKLLAALGLLLLLLAPVLRLVVTAYFAQAPLSPGPEGFDTQVSTGTVTALLDLDGGLTTHPTKISQTVTTRADEAVAASARAAGYNVGVFSTLARTVDESGKVLREENLRLAADRRTQALVDCCGVFVGGVVVPMAGAGNPLRFPAFPARDTYPYFDTVLLTAAPMRFLGEDELNGSKVYKYQQATAPTAVGQVAVPGKLVGSRKETANGVRMYAGIRSVWVDPTTGIILRKAERIRETLRDSRGVGVLALYSADLDYTAEQTAANQALARAQGRPLRLSGFWAPAVLSGAGVLLLGWAGVAGFRRKREAELADDFTDEWASFDDVRAPR